MQLQAHAACSRRIPGSRTGGRTSARVRGFDDVTLERVRGRRLVRVRGQRPSSPPRSRFPVNTEIISR